MYSGLNHNRSVVVIAMLAMLIGLTAAPRVCAAKNVIFVVMSYNDSYSWEVDIRKGIDSVLSDSYRIEYFYLQTRMDVKGGAKKAEEAYGRYRRLQPKGVIAVDDNAQSLFVVPYLRDKVKAPIVFCGVNENPAVYGYVDDENVTGVMEVAHIRDSIILLQQLVPEVKQVAFIMRKGSTAEGFFRQIQMESHTYPASIVAVESVETMDEALLSVRTLRSLSDALFIDFMEGIPDDEGKPLSDGVAVEMLAKAYGKPTFCANRSVLEHGVLCSVVKTGTEQGALAGVMMKKVLKGTPVSDIPITRNKEGRAYINITAMKALGVKPKSAVLQSAELIKAE